MTKGFQKTISLLLAVLMVVTMLPVTAIAEEIENLGCTHHLMHTEECGYAEAVDEVPCGHICAEECAEGCAHEHDEECGYIPAVPGSECSYHCEICEADIIYSDESFYFTSESSLFNEDARSAEITLVRDNAEKETSVTVVVYDNSTNYGKDYIFKVNGEPVEQIEGSVSFYDLLRDESQTVSAIETDANVAFGIANAQQTGEAKEDVNAADMLSMFDDLGIRAAKIPLTFAEGENHARLEIELIDDEESEYDEIFLLAVFDEEGELVETAQQVLGISDNEEEPAVKISFDTEDEVVIDPETGTATINFKREGNLAESSLSVLYYDGEPLGYVNFSPWQKEQTTQVGLAGSYNLYDTEGNILDERTVTVIYSDSTETTLAEGADPELDAIPESYATIPDAIMASIPSWFPDWAKGGSYETETELVYMGTATSNNLFKTGGRTSKGGVDMFNGGNNEHKIYTSGTGSHYHNGYNFIDSISIFTLTGMASVEGRGHVTGVDYNADLMMGIDGVKRTTTRVTSDQVVDLLVEIPFGTQSVKYVYYGNSDPQDKGGGTSFYVPNGFKFNKRPYTFVIDPSKITPLTYYGDELHGTSGYVPSFDGYTTRSTLYINTTNSPRVSIVYEKDPDYPVQLVGFKLYNDKTKAESDTIYLSGNSFAFDRTFLNNYEKTYCWQGDVGNDGTTDYVFTVIPVFEKVKVSSYEIIQGEGKLVLENPNGILYRGDYAVFSEDSSSERVLAGVYYEARTDTSGNAYARNTTWGEDGEVKIKLDSKGTKYVFEPTYNANATSLYVRYGNDSVSEVDGKRVPLNGKLDREEGLYIDKAAYSVNDYVTLVADANDGYITRWTAGYEVYYGDTFYYQLDGISEHNNITVDFVPKSNLTIQKFDITGNVFYNYVTLESNRSTPIYLSNTLLTVTGDTYKYKGTDGKEKVANVYTATTDANGKYTISGFEGVSGGKYTVAVPYNNGTGYATITLGSKNTYNIELPQFATGNSYPFDISVGINGNFNSNIVILESNQNIAITLDVHSPSFDCSPVKVDFYFYASDEDGNKAAEAVKLTETLEAPSRTKGEHTYWDLLIPVDETLDYTRLYVRITSEKQVKTYDQKGNFTGTEKLTVDSGLVDTGYSFINPLVDTTIPIMYDVPEAGGVENAPKVDINSVKIPFIGHTDVSITSKTGGYFVTRTDPDTGVTYLICGYSFDGIYATGSIGDKYENAKKANEKAYAKYKDRETRPAGSSETAVNTTTPEGGGNTGGNTGGNDNGKKKYGDIQFAPAFMFKYILDTGDEPGNENKTFIVGYEMVLGLDVYYFINIPFAIYGVPFFVSFSVGIEAAAQLAIKMKNDKIDTAQDLTKLVLGCDFEKEAEIYESIETMLAFPKLSIVGKAGLGSNNFLSLFLDMRINIPIMFQFTPNFDVGGKFGFSINGGADVVIFSGTFEFFGAEFKYGNMDIVNDLITVQQMQNIASASVMNTYKASAAENQPAEFPDIEQAFENLTFSIMDRNSAMRRGVSPANTISNDNFKNTNVHLLELGNGSVMAFYLKDNGEDTINYLSVASSVSYDGGKTWVEEAYISDNNGKAGSSVQFDVNIFELEDRLLVTWSEADFESLISELGIDKNNVTIPQIAKLMAAMNLRGKFLDKQTGKPISEDFFIAQNPTVACGALDAVQNGEDIYVYYQRNALPDKEDMTIEDIIGIERTIAMASANVNDVQNWSSAPIRVENENGQQYRIVEVEPFVHDGIFGEVIVLDRNGVLASYDPFSETWVPSNDDRQLYLRVYDYNEESGKFETAALRPITQTADNAENPQVASNNDNLYLFWNQNGEIVYIEDFVATENDSEDVRSYNAYVIKNNDGTFVNNKLNETEGTGIASHGTLDPGKKFSVSMSKEGSILLSWISDELLYQDDIPTDEIYGVMLRNVSNAEALRLGEIETDIEGLEDVYQLWAEGRPVALTDENGVLGALDSLCTDEEKGEFLLAFTKLNSDLRSTSTSADVKAVTTSDEPDIEISDIYSEEYPEPGSELVVYIDVTNNGFKALNGGNIYAAADGKEKTVYFDETIWPGTTKTFEVTLNVPEDFSKDTDIRFTVSGNGDQAKYTANDTHTVKYGSYFIITETWQTAIAGKKDDNVAVTVKNIGNAPGYPEISIVNSIFGVEDEPKEYSFRFDEKIVPGGEAKLDCLITDTYMNEEQTARILISTGEGIDQSVQKFMPKPLGINVDGEGNTTVVPGGGSVHEHDWSDWETLNGVRSRRCASCGIVEREYDYPERTDAEENPETGASLVVFGKCMINYIEEAKCSDKKRRG